MPARPPNPPRAPRPLVSERPRTLSEEVPARLREEIVDGVLGLGAALSETMIAARYGVSRTPRARGLRRARPRRAVADRPQQGTFVFRISRAQFGALSEVRSIIETAALRLAFDRNRRALQRQWTRAVKAMQEAARDGRAYCRHDGDFRQAILDLADNPHLIEATQSFATRIAAVRNRLGASPDDHMLRSLAEHEELLRLLSLGCIAAAAELLDHHIRFKGESFWAGAAEHRISLDASGE